MTQNEFLELCANGSYDEIIDAIDSGIDINKHGNIKGCPLSPIFVAVSECNYDAIAALAESGAYCAEGLIAAVASNNIDVIDLLALDYDVNINCRDSHGHNALTSAVMMNRKKILKRLIEYGADVNIKVSENYNALAYAVLMMEDTKDMMYERYKIDPDIIKILMRYGSDYELALLTAIKTNNKKFARELFNNGANPNIKDENGRSAIMYSIIAGGNLLNLLLEYGADPNIPDRNGRTPLMISIVNEDKNLDIIKTLLKNGADPNIQDNKGYTALMWAIASKGDKPDIMIPALIRTGGTRAKGFVVWLALSAFLMAARYELHLEVIRILIKFGADVNICNEKGINALMYAAISDDNEAVDILIEAGAEINFDMMI